MFIEYYITNIDEKEIDIKNNINNVIKYPISAIIAPYSQIKFIKKHYNNIKLGCFIDYPMSCGDIDRRQDLIQDAIKIGVNYIAITIPFYHIVNRKYDKFREDIKTISECISSYPDVEIRYFLEYRIFSYDLLYKIAQILRGYGIKNILPSTGHFLDDINDNILASVMI